MAALASLSQSRYASQTGLQVGAVLNTLERLDHDQNDDRDQHQCGYLVDRTVEAGGMAVAAGREGAAPVPQQQMKAGQPGDQRELGPNPPAAPVDDAGNRGQPGAEQPGHRQRRPHDAAKQPPLHRGQQFAVLRRRGVIDVEPRQVEQSLYKQKTAYEMQHLQPWIETAHPAASTSSASAAIKAGSVPTVGTLR